MICPRSGLLAPGIALVLSVGTTIAEPAGKGLAAQDTGTAFSVNSTCLPPFWAGLLAGTSTEREVRQLLGNGHATERHGESVRLYTDPSKAATLVVEFGTDSIVTSVDLWQGLEAGLPPTAVAGMVTAWLRPSDGIGVWGGVHLGASKAAVQKNMGKPLRVDSEKNLSVWVYESFCSCELATGLTFRFDGDHLVSFGVWALNG